MSNEGQERATQTTQTLVLEARAYVYLLFQTFFGGEPNEETLGWALSEATDEALGLYAGQDTGYDEAYQAWITRSAELKQEHTADPIGLVSSLRSEFTRLFLGPDELVAQPWESLYVTKERVLFQRQTLVVRNAYRAQGFLPAEYPHVADDHIALECAFMAALGKRAFEAAQAGDTEEQSKALRASLDFLDEHLLRWVADYAKDMAKDEQAQVYPLLVKLAACFMDVDQRVVEELVG